MMNIISRWEALVQASNGALPSELRQFQLDTQSLIEAGRHVLVSAPTAAGKSLIQLNGSRLKGGKNISHIQYILNCYNMVVVKGSRPCADLR